MKLKLSLAAALVLLGACATANIPVRQLSSREPIPAGCQDLGPVELTVSGSLFTESFVGTPQYDELRLMAQAKGGDAVQITGTFPRWRGEAYKCGGQSPG